MINEITSLVFQNILFPTDTSSRDNIIFLALLKPSWPSTSSSWSSLSRAAVKAMIFLT